MRDNIKGGALTEVTFFILLALYRPRHGYGIMQFVEERTGGRLVLGAGSLYGALHTLEARGWIAPGGGGGRKKEFLITKAGKTIVQRELARLEELVGIAREIAQEGCI